jgi:ubiquinone/menaquinone biosynthesis C-methylase UbiE
MSQHNLSHPVFARFFVRSAPAMDRGGMADHRRRLLDGLSGEVIEVGAGSGLNFPHYPPEVTRVLAVEPDPYLRAHAEHAANQVKTPIEVVDGIADELPAADASFDVAVASLVLCSVPDQHRALRETHRVLRSGGRLRFLEHVRGESAALQRVQTVLDKTIWPFFVGGCHTGRDTAAAIRTAGFTIDSLDHFRFPDSRLVLPASPHIGGSASRSGGS